MNSEKKIRIKVCGMRDHENIMDVSLLSPDYFGFIFYPHSPRFVGDDFTLPLNLPPSIKRVGVFVNESTDIIAAKSKSIGFDFIQLHGNESGEQCYVLKEEGLHVIKVFSIDDDFKFERTKPYKKAVDYFLFDTKGKYYGGNAKTFNWNALTQYDQEIPFFLSGGVSPENVHKITDLKDINLHALDLNSGVEISPGMKSKEKIEEVMRSTRYEVRSTRRGHESGST